MASQANVLTSPKDVSKHWDSIKAVTDANRESFGFNPSGAYQQAIARGKLWVAVDEKGKYLGHLMHGGKPSKELRIFQIYVDPNSRGAGVAKTLIDALAAYGEELACLNLRADVAQDLSSAVKFWQSVGFCALAPRRKKNATGREVLIFYKRLSTPSLLPSDELPLSIATRSYGENVDTYVIDLNIFLTLLKKRDTEELIAQIMQAAFAGEFSLFVTPEFQTELQRERRNPDPVFELAEATLPVLDKLDGREFQALQAEIRGIVFPDRSANRKGATQDASDLRHIAHCVQNSIAGFITNEGALLRAKEKLQEKYGLTIYSPQDFKIGYLANAQSGSLAVPLFSPGGSVSVSALKSANQVRGFLDGLELASQDISKIVAKSSARGEHDKKVVAVGDDVCGVYVSRTKGAKHDVLEGFFLSGGDFPNREAVFQHLLECFVRHGQAVSARSVVFHVREADFDLEKTCLERGFLRATTALPGMIALAKIPCPPLVTKSNWSDFRASFAEQTEIELPRLMPSVRMNTAGTPIIQAVKKGQVYDAELFKLETLLSPTLIMQPQRKGLILPITPTYASNLLSRSEDLLPFPLEEEALLRVEKAYYRKPSHSNVLSVGRPILFYESQSGRGVIGCGRITSVKVTSTDNALKLYRRYGVLDAQALADYADKSGQVQVIKFDSFKEFQKPVSMKRLHELGCAKANLVGPEVISDDQLWRICHEGMGIHVRDVLISIQPDFVAKILSGKKTIELRKKPFPANGGVRVWIYSTSPTSAIEATAFVETVDCDTSENIWNKYQHKCGVSKADFDAYFDGASEAYAISITRPRKLDRRFKLDDIKKLLDGFTPPQYYRYVDHDTELFDALISRAST
ncbi:GNAT family N-acetyltransferase [Hyphomicrobium sp.]|uniref:GNAT family N-acetyltransferase n=1 Tax=Hyphomicrobium sp. TaxID=82 RepID=UPI001D6AB3B5|nr:GNAT family N-acetyltransferase [Hyphomicrobium sp.]MBY0562514.1 GNAT family N-acetyltransferase [Hyphomicrobium sp.]